jgi:hypothetical protein
MKWRTGRKVPINVYEGDRPVCQCQTAEDAKLIVAAVNHWLDDMCAYLGKAPADASKKQPDTPEQLSHSEVEGAEMPRRSQARKDRT